MHYSGGTSVDSIVNKVDTIVNHADEFISTGLEMNKRLAGYDCKMFIQLGKKKNIVIVGGGVAGKEAARVVRLRGHDVTIYEKSDIFGCNLIPTHTRDFKYEVGGSSPFTSSKQFAGSSRQSFYGRIPEWPKGADCKSVAFRFDGSNPSSPTKH